MVEADDGERDRLTIVPLRENPTEESDPWGDLLGPWRRLEYVDRLLVIGTLAGMLGAALVGGVGVGLLFASAVCFSLVALHLWVEAHQPEEPGSE